MPRRRPHAVARVVQLDLFDEVDKVNEVVLDAERRRHHDALLCLRDAMPDALQVVVDLCRTASGDTRAPRSAGNWAYCVSRAGLRVESVNQWGAGAHARGETYGWDRTPAHLVTWTELTALVGGDPRRTQIAAWVNDLPQPRWKVLMRPHELWPDPGGWHQRYLCHDHVHEQWTRRRKAWQLLHDLLTDAITRVSTGTTEKDKEHTG